ncbi:hypothetical protein N2152v2_008831 [Parachlorella kessleri]
MTKQLALVVYRGLLAWAKRNAGVPMVLKSTDVYTVFPAARALSSFDLHDPASVSQLASLAFKAGKHLQGEEASAALNGALHALRLLNTEYASQLQLMRETRADKANKAGVSFEVGTVFMHKKFGYRGLVIGWDRQCTRDEDWVHEAGVDPRQPFYYVLPDESDCVRLFGQPLSSRYVAQDNILTLPGERILHRALNHYFSGHSRALGRYIPSKKLQYEYPGFYGGDDTGRECVASDSNLLLHPEEEGEDQKAGVAGQGSGRRRSCYKSVKRGGQEVTI